MTKKKTKKKKHDNYPTPKVVALATCRWLAERGINPKRVLEPSAGSGAYVAAIRVVWPKAHIVAIEVREKCKQKLKDAGADEVIIGRIEDVNLKKQKPFDLVVGNPPFSLAVPHIHRLHKKSSGKRPSVIAFLLRMSFLGSVKRSTSFWPVRPLSELKPFARRPSFMGHGKTDNSEYGFYVWRPRTKPEVALLHPPLHWKGK